MVQQILLSKNAVIVLLGDRPDTDISRMVDLMGTLALLSTERVDSSEVDVVNRPGWLEKWRKHDSPALRMMLQKAGNAGSLVCKVAPEEAAMEAGLPLPLWGFRVYTNCENVGELLAMYPGLSVLKGVKGNATLKLRQEVPGYPAILYVA